MSYKDRGENDFIIPCANVLLIVYLCLTALIAVGTFMLFTIVSIALGISVAFIVTSILGIFCYYIISLTDKRYSTKKFTRMFIKYYLVGMVIHLVCLILLTIFLRELHEIAGDYTLLVLLGLVFLTVCLFFAHLFFSIQMIRYAYKGKIYLYSKQDVLNNNKFN